MASGKSHINGVQYRGGYWSVFVSSVRTECHILHKSIEDFADMHGGRVKSGMPRGRSPKGPPGRHGVRHPCIYIFDFCQPLINAAYRIIFPLLCVCVLESRLASPFSFRAVRGP